MQRTIKIGTNRGVARLWLEGKCLEQHGWTTGVGFVYSINKDCIIYTKAQKTPNGKPRRVAGKEGRPVIDTNNKMITATANGKTHMEVTITDSQIMFKPTDKPDSKLKTTVTKALLVAGAITLPFISTFKPDAKKILVACEESGRVRDSFIQMGHDAVSVDLMDSESPDGWHIKDDVMNHIYGDWDMVIAFPPCTYLTNSAAWAFNDPDYEKYPEIGYHQRVKESTLVGQSRRDARELAIAMFMEIYESNEHVAIENPTGALSSAFRKPDQIIQPWQFGTPHSKSTCLWLKNLPLLVPTQVLTMEEHGYLASNGTQRWLNQTGSGQSNVPPSANRDTVRSKTYHGVAAAMATQWMGDLS